MNTFSSRRFRPTLDVLSLRLTPGGSGLLDCPPLQPTLDPWQPLSVPVDVSPLDPTLNPVELPGGGDMIDIEITDQLATDIVLVA